ncbi:MAG: O-antigen ligase family protein [Patescibacteria group bacterium]
MDTFLIVLIAYLPFQLALNPSAGIDLASIRVLILGAFFVWLAVGLRKKRLVVKKNIQTGLVITFLFLNVLSLLVARNTDWSSRKLLFLFSIFPVYFVASQAVNKREKILKASQTIVFSATAAATVGLVQFFAQFLFGLESVYKFWADHVIEPFLGKTFAAAVLQNPSWLVNISGKTYLRATATFPDPHMFSFFLGLVIPLALALAVLSEKKIFYSLALVILLLADAATFSRGGYLGLFAGLVLAITLSWPRLKKVPKVLAAGLAVLLAVILIIPNPVSKRYFSSFDLKEGSNEGRMEMWQKAVSIALNNPLNGVGIGNYPLEIKPGASYRDPIYAHNTYLDIAAETGILSTLAFLGILIFAIKSFLKKSRESLIFLASAISLTIFAIHSLVETAIYSPVVLTLFLIIVSFSNAEEKNKPDKNFGAYVLPR